MMLVRSLRAELFALRRRPGVWILGGVWALQVIVFAYVVFYVVHRVQGPDMAPGQADGLLRQLLPESVGFKVLGSMPVYGGPVMLVIGVLIAASDYRWGTLQTILSRGGDRSGFLVGRFLGMTVVMAVIAVVSLVLSVVCSTVVAAAVGRPAVLPSVADLGVFLLAMTLVCTAWGALGFLLGQVTRNPATAIAIGLLWTLGLENGINGLAYALPALDGLRVLMLSANTGALAHALGAPTMAAGGAPGVVDIVTGPVAVATLLGYAVVALAAGLAAFRRRDIAS